jgi:hypothetical protein
VHQTPSTAQLIFGSSVEHPLRIVKALSYNDHLDCARRPKPHKLFNNKPNVAVTLHFSSSLSLSASINSIVFSCLQTGNSPNTSRAALNPKLTEKKDKLKGKSIDLHRSLQIDSCYLALLTLLPRLLTATLSCKLLEPSLASTEKVEEMTDHF